MSGTHSHHCSLFVPAAWLADHVASQTCFSRNPALCAPLARQLRKSPFVRSFNRTKEVTLTGQVSLLPDPSIASFAEELQVTERQGAWGYLSFLAPPRVHRNVPHVPIASSRFHNM